MNVVELKIKAKHLAYEPAIIRKEENRLKRIARKMRESQKCDRKVMNKMFSLQAHRRHDVKLEARATHLARAFLAGKSYSDVEGKRRSHKEEDFRFYVLKRITSMVNKYKTKGTQDVTIEQIADWTGV